MYKFPCDYFCLNLLPMIVTPESRASFFTGILSANNKPFDEIVDFAEEHHLFDPLSPFCIGSRAHLQNNFHKHNNCKHFLHAQYANTKFVCYNCCHNSRTSYRNSEEQDLILSYLFHHPDRLRDSHVKISSNSTVMMNGDIHHSLFLYLFDVRKSILNALLKARDLGEIIKLVQKDFLDNSDKNAKGDTELNSVLSDLSDEVRRILSLEVNDEAFATACAANKYSDSGRKVFRSKPAQENIEQIDLRTDFTDFPETHDELFSDSINAACVPPTDPDCENSKDQAEEPTETTDGTADPDLMQNPLQREAQVFFQSFAQPSPNSTDETITEESVKESNSFPSDPSASGEPDPVIIKASFTEGIYLDKANYKGYVYVVNSYDTLTALLEVLCYSDFVSAEIVTCGSVTGLLISGDSLTRYTQNNKPFFIREEFFSKELFEEVINSRQFRFITMNLELLLEYARRYGISSTKTGYSLRAAYKAYNEGNDELYPFTEILSVIDQELVQGPAPFILQVFSNYQKLRTALIIQLDDRRLAKKESIWRLYEIALSSSNNLRRELTADFDNLTRHSYSKNSFAYEFPFAKRKYGTIIECRFRFETGRENLPYLFLPELLMRIITVNPTAKLRPSVYSYGNDHIIIFVNTKRKENISEVEEMLHASLAQLVQKHRLPAFTYADKTY